MSFLSILLIIIYVLVCIFLILVVLLQQGKGADLAGAFGGGGSQTSFGPRTSTNIMHRLTTFSFVVFVVLSMTLAVLSGKHRAATVMSEVAVEPTATATEESGEPAMGAAEEAEEAEPAGETGAATSSESPAEAPATMEEEPAPASSAPVEEEPGSGDGGV